MGKDAKERVCPHQSAGRPSVPSSPGAVGHGPVDPNTAAA